MAEGKITVTGRVKLCKAHAGGASLPAIVKMAFGSGGVDESGAVIPATGEEITLRNQLLMKDIDGHTISDSGTTSTFSCRLSKEELAGENISEQGLFDADGDLVAYKSLLPKGKDGDMEFVFHMEEIF